MQPTFISLESIQIAAPCRADWNAMQPVHGQDCVRFCHTCGKNVYNLSGMTRTEAERLIGEGDLCVRLRRRSDGTVLTSDCPIGSSSVKRRNWGVQIAATAIGFVTALLGLRGVLTPREPEYTSMGSISIAPTVPITPPTSSPANAPSFGNSGSSPSQF